LKPPVSPGTVLFPHLHEEFLNFAGLAGPTWMSPAAAIVLLSDELRCQRSGVSGVTIVTTSAQELPSQSPGFGGKPATLSSLSRNRLSPSCSRRTQVQLSPKTRDASPAERVFRCSPLFSYPPAVPQSFSPMCVAHTISGPIRNRMVLVLPFYRARFAQL
jgi:hypothetical protein